MDSSASFDLRSTSIALRDIASQDLGVPLEKTFSSRDISLIHFHETHPNTQFSEIYNSLRPGSIKEIDTTEVPLEKFNPKIIFDGKLKEWQIRFDDGETNQPSLMGATEFRANMLTMVEAMRSLDCELQKLDKGKQESVNVYPLFYAIFKTTGASSSQFDTTLDIPQCRVINLNPQQYWLLHQTVENFVYTLSAPGYSLNQ